MQWSKYNLLFRSEKYGYLLYNTLTNVFVEIDRGTYRELEKIRQSPETYDFTNAPALYLQLLTAKMLVEPREEATLLNVIKLQRMGRNFSETVLNLTIVPTLACNFNCPYCYESHRRPVHMTEQTEAKIIEFFRRFKAVRVLSLTWYGGEPLLRFETIRRLTEQIQTLDLRFHAKLITNGYLLNDEVIAQLDALKITSIQLTLDGPEDVHNVRRPLASGGKTYRRIMTNLENLLGTSWKGRIEIRINVDATNHAQYAALYYKLLEQFPDKNLLIYPGIVSDSQAGNPDIHCQFTKDEEARFLIELYKAYGIDNLLWYYPRNSFGCLATSRNGFVIGPEGEVYKCWYDVGDPKMIVGSIYDEQSWNVNMIANYMMGTNPFDDPMCQECFYLPVCDGGCAHFRLLNNYYGGHFNTCAKFKHALPEFLEIYYELKQKHAKNNSKDKKEEEGLTNNA